MSTKRITKTQRIKIDIIESPTSDWNDFAKIFDIIQKETILASNKVMSLCNVYNSVEKEYRDKWVLDNFHIESKKFRNVLYQTARSYCQIQYSGSANTISNTIFKKYFSGSNSWSKKIEKGEGNPPMTFTDKIPIYIRNNQTSPIKVECVDYDKGYYSLSASYLNRESAKGIDYEEKEGKKKPIQKHIEVNGGRLSFRFRVKKSGKLETLMKNLTDESSGYKTGDSQLMRKKNKKTHKWEYWFMLAYSCDKKERNKELDKDRILGVDVGVVVPLYATINQKEWIHAKFGDNRIHKQAMKDMKIRAEKQAAITYNLKNGHGRKYKLDGYDGAGGKTANRQNTYNHQLARQLVNYAVRKGCGTIHLEDLSGMKEQEKDNLFLKSWTYYNLQEQIINKALEEGIVVAKVNRFGTSQTCPCCGVRDAKNRPKGRKKQFYFECVKCGYKDNADHVAAINIARAEPLKGKIYD